MLPKLRKELIMTILNLEEILLRNKFEFPEDSEIREFRIAEVDE